MQWRIAHRRLAPQAHLAPPAQMKCLSVRTVKPCTAPPALGAHADNRGGGCRKLATIPFPFPYAQIVTAALLFFTLTLPLMLAAFIRSPGHCAAVAALTAVLYWGAHEVSRELEDPFLIWSSTYNCLPFTALQYGFNEDILAFAYSVVRRLLPHALTHTPPHWQGPFRHTCLHAHETRCLPLSSCVLLLPREQLVLSQRAPQMARWPSPFT